MEVLSIDVMHNIWFLVELVTIEVLNSNTDFSALLNVESVGDEGEIWVHESHEVGNLNLKVIFWVEDQLDPANSSLWSNIILDWSSNLSLAKEGTVDHLVEQASLKSNHISKCLLLLNL